MSEHDLRRRAQRLTDLRRRYEAHDILSDEEKAELQRGIPPEDMREIVSSIRQERRAATPSKKTKAVEKTRAQSKPVDIHSFLDEEYEIK